MPKVSHLGIPISFSPSSSPSSSSSPSQSSTSSYFSATSSSIVASPFHLMESFFYDLLTPLHCSYNHQFLNQPYKLSSTTPSSFIFQPLDSHDPCHSTVTASPLSWLLNHIARVDLLPEDVDYVVDKYGMMLFRLSYHHRHHSNNPPKNQKQFQHQHQQSQRQKQHTTSIAHLFVSVFNGSFIQQDQRQKDYSNLFPNNKESERKTDNFVIFFTKRTSTDVMNDETRIFSLSQSVLLTFDLYNVARNNNDVVFRSADVTLVLTYVTKDF